MYRFKCPKCGTRMRWWPRGFWEWRSGRTRCASCGVWVQLPSPLFDMLALLFAVGYAAFLVYRPPTDRPVWLGLVALLMVPLLLVLWQSGIAWVRVLPRGPRDSPLVRKWTWIADLTSAVFFLVCLMSVALPLWYAGRLLRIARGLPPREAIAVLERVDAWFQFMTWGPLAVIVVGVGFMVFAYLKLRKARKADEAAAEESQGGERGRG